jgi:hypothetical protein
MTAGRVIQTLRVEAALAGTAYAGLLVLAHPHAAAARLDLAAYPWANRLFYAGMVVALAALGCLALRLWGRLLASGRRRPVAGECRAAAGTVVVEFALVFPIVLLVMCMIVQLFLIANAVLVVRYATFAAARSAIVNFEADQPDAWLNNPLSLAQFPPFPEWVDKTRPELAAHLVLASISPETGGGTAEAQAMEVLLQAQGGVWAGRSYATRMEYARAATEVKTLRDKLPWYGAWYASFSPMIQQPEHLIPPYRLKNNETQFYLPLPPVPQIPQVPGLNQFINPVNQAILDLAGLVSAGASGPLTAFAGTPLNADIFSPKRVEITVDYDFALTLPGLQIIPGLTKDTPIGTGRAFAISHTVSLQSTGGRRSNPAAFIFPVPKQIRRGALRENSPMYWSTDRY